MEEVGEVVGTAGKGREEAGGGRGVGGRRQEEGGRRGRRSSGRGVKEAAANEERVQREGRRSEAVRRLGDRGKGG